MRNGLTAAGLLLIVKAAISVVGALTEWHVKTTDLIDEAFRLGFLLIGLWLYWQSSKLINGLSENQPTKIDNEAA